MHKGRRSFVHLLSFHLKAGRAGAGSNSGRFLRDRQGDWDEMPEGNRRYVMQRSWKQGLIHHFFSEVKVK